MRLTLPAWFRARVPYVALAIGTIALGLAVHYHGRFLGLAARDMLGDAVWAVMMVWWVSAIAPAVRLRWRAVVALALCYAVELSQLYRAPGFDALRRTTVGHLVLGNGFDPRDLAAYAVGVLAAVLLGRAVLHRPRDIDKVAQP